MKSWIVVTLLAVGFALSGCDSSDGDGGGGGGSGAGGSGAGGSGGGAAACFATPWLTPSCIACRQANCEALMVDAFGADWMTPGSFAGKCGAAYNCECACPENDSACITPCVNTIDTPCIDSYTAANVCGQGPCDGDCSM